MESLETFVGLLYISIIIPLIPLCFYPVQEYVKSRISVLVAKIILALFSAVLCMVLVEIFISPVMKNTDLILYPASIYCFYLYDREVRLPFSKKLFVFLSVCLVGGFSKLYAVFLDYSLHPLGNPLSLEGLGVQVLFLAAADVVLYLPFSRHMGWMMSNFHEEAVWKRLCCFPAFSLAATYFMYPRVYRNMYVGNLLMFYPVVLLFFTTFVVLIYFMFYIIIRSFVEKQKAEVANQMLSIQGAQYEQLLRTVEENSRIRHDFRHQLIVISELAGHKEYEKLKKYVGRYIDSVQTEMKMYSYSAALNALVSYYESICQGKKIHTDFSISLPERIPVSEQDFCVMLGNLLENAIKGVQDTDEPYISLKIRQTASNMLAVKVSNPYRGEVVKEDGHYRSSKRGGFGQGLESVNMIALKHDGMMEVLTDRKVFTVKVLLQIPAEE